MNDLLSVTPKPHIDLPLLHVVLCIACFQSHQTAYRMLFLNGLHARLHNYRSTCFPMQGPLSVTSNTYRSIPEPRNELKREMPLGPHSIPFAVFTIIWLCRFYCKLFTLAGRHHLNIYCSGGGCRSLRALEELLFGIFPLPPPPPFPPSLIARVWSVNVSWALQTFIRSLPPVAICMVCFRFCASLKLAELFIFAFNVSTSVLCIVPWTNGINGNNPLLITQ